MTDQTTPGQGSRSQAPTTQTTPAIPEQVIREEAVPQEDLQGQVTPTEVLPEEELEEQAAPEAVPPRHRLRLRRARPRRQSAFRRWRKTRPFWGGFFTMLGGIEIAVVTGASYELILLSKSVAFAITVGLVIAVFGLTMWLSPVLSKLLGLLTLVAALLSFVTANLGGFLMGMLFAIIGGGLCFAWQPGVAPVVVADAVEGAGETVEGEEDVTVDEDTDQVGLDILEIPEQRAPEATAERRLPDGTGD